jgi:hypothetical protein
VLFRDVRRSPLVQAGLLAAAGYIVFIGMHNSPQPRYYMVLAYPVVFVTMLAVQRWVAGGAGRRLLLWQYWWLSAHGTCR